MELVISLNAERDIEKAKTYYDTHSIVAGDWFMDELYLYTQRILKYPERYELVNDNVHKCLLKRFPYKIFYSIKPGVIIILRVRHAKQKPLTRYT